MEGNHVVEVPQDRHGVVINPATEEVVAEVPFASAARVDAVIEAADSAASTWRRTPVTARGQLIFGGR